MAHRKKYEAKDEFAAYIRHIQDEHVRIYVTDRVIRQIHWYDRKGSVNKSGFRWAMAVSILLSALIPVFTLLADSPYELTVKIIITALSSCITAISAVSALYRFRELWIQYRTYCEILKSVLHRFFTLCGEFQGLHEKDAFPVLVASCEQYMTKEYQVWATHVPSCDRDHSASS